MDQQHPPSATAASHLRAIRLLMEQATQVHAITEKAAWVAGCGSLALAGAASVYPPSQQTWWASWLTLLAIVTTVNFWQLRSLAAREERPFPSPLLWRVARCMAPGLLAGFLLSLRATTTAEIATYWVLGQGLAMLGATQLIPRALVWLGSGFFISAAILLCLPTPLLANIPGSIIMAATFGQFFVIFAGANRFKSA